MTDQNLWPGTLRHWQVAVSTQLRLRGWARDAEVSILHCVRQGHNSALVTTVCHIGAGKVASMQVTYNSPPSVFGKYKTLIALETHKFQNSIWYLGWGAENVSCYLNLVWPEYANAMIIIWQFTQWNLTYFEQTLDCAIFTAGLWTL